MLAEDRARAIVELVRSEGFQAIDALAIQFGVTPQTIRRDVNLLCDRGLLRRKHGGVELPPEGENLAYPARQVLNIELMDLEQSLMRAWHLPEVLMRMTDDRHASQPQVRNVMLAIRLARHSRDDWDDPAIPDDITDIAALLNVSESAAYNLVSELDA